jgi:hypothetical protein
LSFYGKKLNRVAAYPMILFVLAIILFDVSQNIIPSAPLAQGVFEQKIVNMDREEACPCWWPIWAQSGAFSQPEFVAANGRTASVLDWSRESRDLSVAPGDAADLRIATFYHPYWNATVNGSDVPVGRDANGAILIPLPPAAADVHLYFKEPGFLRITLIVSIVVWAAFAVFLVGYLVRFRGIRPTGV